MFEKQIEIMRWAAIYISRLDAGMPWSFYIQDETGTGVLNIVTPRGTWRDWHLKLLVLIPPCDEGEYWVTYRPMPGFLVSFMEPEMYTNKERS
jgi:hypothetical protein